MSRSQRLFDLLQLLRCHKYPVAAEHLAQSLNVSVRTIYRDIATLQAQGADVEGEAGVGYVLKPSFMLPPLMFSLDELEVLLLGAEWVSKQTGGEFNDAATNAIAKIAAVLPSDHHVKRHEETISVGPISAIPALSINMAEIRGAIKQQLKIEIKYRDAKGNQSKRMIWPILIGLFQDCYMMVAWCETRSDFRHFRLDRIDECCISSEKYSGSRRELLSTWRQQEGINEKGIGY